MRFPVELPGLSTCPVVSPSLSNVRTIQQIPSALPRTVRNIISAALWAKLQGQEHGNSPAGGRERSELQLKQQLCYQQDRSLQDHSCPSTSVRWPPALTLLIVSLLCFLRMWGRVCCLSDEVRHAALSSPDPEQDGCGARERDWFTVRSFPLAG